MRTASAPIPPSIDDLVLAARALVPRLEATSEASEQARRLDPAAVLAMRETGLSRLLVPRRFGGYELSIRAQILTCRETALGCSATSWVQMVCGAHDFVLGGFAEECLGELFADGPDMLVPGTLSPQGTVTRAPGGWRLEGRWQFCSGVDLSPWIMIGARQTDVASDPDPWRVVHVIARKQDVEIDDTWHVLGMRGTGSKDVVARGAFVPIHRSMPTVPLFTGLSPHASSAVYRLPVLPVLASMLAGSVLGMAERGYRAFLERTRVRQDVYVGGAKAASPGIQRRLSEARAELDAAERLLLAICDRWEELMAEDRPPIAIERRVGMRWDAAYVVELCRRAVERLFAAAGAHAVYDPSELQRVYRDVNTASHHAIVDLDNCAELAGKALLGLDLGKEAAIS